MKGRLGQAFRLAAGELGMASAAWLFVEECARDGDERVRALRDELGRDWPVLDAVCAGWEQGVRAPVVDATEVTPALEGVARLVVVGHETLWLDALVAALPASVRIGLVRQQDLVPDWERVASNWRGRVELLGLGDFQAWAGAHSGLLTFVYGDGRAQLFTLPAWLRVSGPDVRTQFRALVGWQVLRLPLLVYPRWLAAAEGEGFTSLEPS